MEIDSSIKFLYRITIFLDKYMEDDVFGMGKYYKYSVRYSQKSEYRGGKSQGTPTLRTKC